MGNKVAVLFLALLGSFLGVFGQSVTIGTIDAGPYGTGSSIAVSVKINDLEGKLKTNNVFKLYISDVNTSFLSPIEIGTYPGFYTTFINGVIPAGLVPGDYKVIVKYADGTLTSEASNSFKVIANNRITADIDANVLQKLSDSPKTFGVCKPETKNVFRFSNISTAGAAVSITATNEATAISEIYNFNETPFAINADMAHYTLFVKATLNGTIGTKAFFLI
ncbi:MAG TPA: hypothetical protein VFM79_02005, partial [Pelobium sp.]|nr:hypothetical protein [Pelobium sp.]